MNFGKWIVAGVIGGVISAAVWAGISYFTGYEIGWIAWLVGFVVGVSVRVAAGSDVGIAPGIVAAGIAILSLLGGKYAAVTLHVNKAMGENTAMLMNITPEEMQVSICADVAQQWTTEKKKMKWPPGKNLESAVEIIDYPQAVRDEARKQWDAKPAAEQQQLIDERQAQKKKVMDMIGGIVKQQGFAESFNGYDILFFLLAIVTAFRVGSGMSSD